jgi:Cu(I)/Ag(I) efflux system membrane protein CusA/SilA
VRARPSAASSSFDQAPTPWRPSPAVKERLAELKDGLPDDVEISVAYDRTALIERSVETLTRTLIEESIIVALVCVVFLFHFRSAFVAILSIPVSILLAFVIMRVQGLGANIMSLGGIAISIGVLVDASVVMVENAHKHYEEWQGKRSHFEIILRSAQEVGPTLFFTLLVITVSFMPVFTLQAQEGRLFRPLAFTKTYAMLGSAIVAVTIIPVLMFWFVPRQDPLRGTPPGVAVLRAVYTPVLKATLCASGGHRAGAIASGGVADHPDPADRLRVHAAFVGGRSALHAHHLSGHLHHQGQRAAAADRQDHRFVPGGGVVFGKIGRAETATDPAPLSMIETTIVLKDPNPSGGRA